MNTKVGAGKVDPISVLDESAYLLSLDERAVAAINLNKARAAITALVAAARDMARAERMGVLTDEHRSAIDAALSAFESQP